MVLGEAQGTHNNLIIRDMKQLLKKLLLMLVLWAILYSIGLVVTGEFRPWEWGEHGSALMAVAMFFSAIAALTCPDELLDNQ